VISRRPRARNGHRPFDSLICRLIQMICVASQAICNAMSPRFRPRFTPSTLADRKLKNATRRVAAVAVRAFIRKLDRAVEQLELLIGDIGREPSRNGSKGRSGGASDTLGSFSVEAPSRPYQASQPLIARSLTARSDHPRARMRCVLPVAAKKFSRIGARRTRVCSN